MRKNVKRLLASLLVFVLTLAMGSTVYAADEFHLDTGSDSDYKSNVNKYRNSSIWR